MSLPPIEQVEAAELRDDVDFWRDEYRSLNAKMKFLYERSCNQEKAQTRLEAKYALAVRVCEEAATLAHALGWDDDRYICQALEAWGKEHHED